MPVKTVVLADKETGTIKQIGIYPARAKLENFSRMPCVAVAEFRGNTHLESTADEVLINGHLISRFNNNTTVFTSSSGTALSLSFYRQLGFGDAVICASLGRRVKQQWPNSYITFNVAPQWVPVFKSADGLDEVVARTYREIPVNRYDGSFMLDGIFDGSNDSREMSRPAVLYRKLGLGDPEPVMAKPWITVPDQDRQEARDWLRDRGVTVGKDKVVGFQLDCTTLLRTYPEDLRNRALLDLVSIPGVKVVQFGLTTTPAHATPLAHASAVDAMNLSLTRTAALMACCDVMVAPDSGLLHLSCALGRPTVALFGNMPAMMRVGSYTTVHVLQAESCPCARFPCYEEANTQGWGMSHCLVPGGRGVLCLRQIDPSQVVAKVVDLLGMTDEAVGRERVYVLEVI